MAGNDNENKDKVFNSLWSTNVVMVDGSASGLFQFFVEVNFVLCRHTRHYVLIKIEIWSLEQCKGGQF